MEPGSGRFRVTAPRGIGTRLASGDRVEIDAPLWTQLERLGVIAATLRVCGGTLDADGPWICEVTRLPALRAMLSDTAARGAAFSPRARDYLRRVERLAEYAEALPSPVVIERASDTSLSAGRQ